MQLKPWNIQIGHWKLLLTHSVWKGCQDILFDVEKSKKPVIAAIMGSCLGGGLEVGTKLVTSILRFINFVSHEDCHGLSLSCGCQGQEDGAGLAWSSFGPVTWWWRDSTSSSTDIAANSPWSDADGQDSQSGQGQEIGIGRSDSRTTGTRIGSSRCPVMPPPPLI